MTIGVFLKGIIGIIVLIVIAAWIFGKSESSEPPNNNAKLLQEKAPSAATQQATSLEPLKERMTVDEVRDDYGKNYELAKQKYYGKKFIITGVVLKVNEPSNKLQKDLASYKLEQWVVFKNSSGTNGFTAIIDGNNPISYSLEGETISLNCVGVDGLGPSLPFGECVLISTNL